VGAHYDMFRKAKDYLRRHPDATDEDVAGVTGIKLAFTEEARLIGEARKELKADHPEVYDLNHGTAPDPYRQ
jgi:hypothetical protein